MSTFHRTNGHVPGRDADAAARTALARLTGIGRAPDEELPLLQGPLFAADTEPPHNIKRHSEDPRRAYEATAREVCDPEEIRIGAVATGKTSQAVDRESFERLLRKAFRGIRRVRAGAITGPARVAAGQQLKISATTEIDAKRIVTDRAADGLKADRYTAEDEDSKVNRAKQKIADCKTALETVEAIQREKAEAVAELRPAGLRVDERPGGLPAWVLLPAKAAVGLAVLDIGVTTVVLQPPVSDLVDTTQLGSYLIAGGISAALIAASGAAGFAVAALRLSARAVGVAMLTLFALIMLKLVSGLDALREGSPTGVETLTAATLACCYVAGLTAYARTTYQDFRERRELTLQAGTPLGDALEERDVANAGVAQAKTNLAAAVAELDGLFDEIEGLRDSAARADAAALDREARGTDAEVEVATIDSLARTGVEQEIAANEEWAVAMGQFAYEKARAETPPEGDEVRDPDAPPVGIPQPERSKGLTRLQKAGVAVLAAGALGGLVLTPYAVPVGAGVAALLFCLSTRGPKSGEVGRTGSADPVLSGPPPIGSTADGSNPLYRRQPDHMVAKYGDGGAGPGEHQ